MLPLALGGTAVRHRDGAALCSRDPRLFIGRAGGLPRTVVDGEASPEPLMLKFSGFSCIGDQVESVTDCSLTVRSATLDWVWPDRLSQHTWVRWTSE